MTTREFAYLEINQSNFKDALAHISFHLRPHWQAGFEEIEVRNLNSGITNSLYACFLKSNGLNCNDTLLFRVYAQGTELFLTRTNEIESMKLVQEMDLGPYLFVQFRNGICYEFLPGRVLDQKMVHEDERVYRKLAEAISSLHFINFTGFITERGLSTSRPRQKPFVFAKIRSFLDLVKPDYMANMRFMTDEYLKSIPSVSSIADEVSSLEQHLVAYANEKNSLIVFCHNDLGLSNMVYNGDCVKFIDFEYAGINYQAYDIANMFNEFAGLQPDYSLFPGKEYQLNWIRLYLSSFYLKVNKFHLKETNEKLMLTEEKIWQFYVEVNKFTLAAHLMWAVWSLLHAQNAKLSYDFVRYAQIRFNEYFKNKERLFKLK